jgi:quercetin dioxygenase-like cupin family protein
MIKDIDNMIGVATSHGAGLKKVLCSNAETDSNITQIAMTTLRAGEVVDAHVHADMEEHFIFEQGDVELTLNDDLHLIHDRKYVLIPRGVKHGIKALTDCRLITVGCVVGK